MAEYYRHFKGKVYRLVSVAKDSDTLDKIVVYQAMYENGDIWVRPYDEFFGKVDRDGMVGIALPRSVRKRPLIMRLSTCIRSIIFQT